MSDVTRERVLGALSACGPSTRAALARQLGLSRSTVSAVVGHLRAEGLVAEAGSVGGAEVRPGRPGVPIAIDPSVGAAIGVDFGHSHVRVLVADLSHAVLGEEERSLTRDHNASEAMDAAVELIEATLASSGMERSRVVAVGMGLPGPIDSATGAAEASSISPAWVGVKVAPELGGRIGLPVVIDNDANLGALAESVWGAGRGAEVLVYLKIGAGIGAGIVLGGSLFRGAAGMAGEIGHITMDPAGPLCRCGNRGCLESFVGTAALRELAAGAPGRGGPNVSRELGDGSGRMLARINRGDRGLLRLLDDTARTLGIAVANLVNLLNPDVVVLGGELGETQDMLLAPVREVVDRMALPGAAARVRIVSSLLGSRAEALGAVALALRQANRPRRQDPTASARVSTARRTVPPGAGGIAGASRRAHRDDPTLTNEGHGSQVR